MMNEEFNGVAMIGHAPHAARASSRTRSVQAGRRTFRIRATSLIDEHVVELRAVLLGLVSRKQPVRPLAVDRRCEARERKTDRPR
jgi:hypothetical protein